MPAMTAVMPFKPLIRVKRHISMDFWVNAKSSFRFASKTFNMQILLGTKYPTSPLVRFEMRILSWIFRYLHECKYATHTDESVFPIGVAEPCDAYAMACGLNELTVIQVNTHVGSTRCVRLKEDEVPKMWWSCESSRFGVLDIRRAWDVNPNLVKRVLYESGAIESVWCRSSPDIWGSDI